MAWIVESLFYFILFFIASCLKTINSKKYGVDLVCFTSHPTTVIYSSKNGWDGMLLPIYFWYMLIPKMVCVHGLIRITYLCDFYNQNLWGCYHCMTTSICGILKVTMTGWFLTLAQYWQFYFSILKYCLLWTYLFNKRISSILVPRVVSLSLCSRKECFISGSLDRTVLLWDQRAEKCQVEAFAYRFSFSEYVWSITKLYLSSAI